MSKSLRSDGCGSGVTSERQCGQSLASSRMGSAQNGHKRLPRWLSADFERGVGSAKIRTQAISGEISIARKNQPKPLRPLASAINPTASAKMNQNTNAVSIPGTPLLPVVGVTLNLEWASAQGYRLLLKVSSSLRGPLKHIGVPMRRQGTEGHHATSDAFPRNALPVFVAVGFCFYQSRPCQNVFAFPPGTSGRCGGTGLAKVLNLLYPSLTSGEGE
jgi:hypothetical protein